MIRTRMLASSYLALLAALTFVAPRATAASPAFVAVDIHPSPERLHPQIHGHFAGDRVLLRDATLTDLISEAYKVEPADLLGGPAWLDFDRFDIVAKAPEGTRFTDDDDDPKARAMLQSLLAERFGLVAKTETRPLPAYILTVSKPGKLKPAADATDVGGCQWHAQAGQGGGPSEFHLTCHGLGMDSVADIVREVGQSAFNRPVLDQTGLKGKFDIELQWTFSNTPEANVRELADALSSQLGLKLERKPVSTPVLIIKSVNQKPTPNIAGIEKILPPAPPAQFDVAVIRPANPAEKNFNEEISGNRVTVQYATLQTLIYKSFDTPPGKIENKPKWLDDQHWDIVGTVASSSPVVPKPGEFSGIDEEDAKEMIQSLLVERFGLVTHTGSRPSEVFALVAGNPTMKKASDTEHPGCAEGPGPDGKDPRTENPQRDRLLSCQNMTMAQFATELHRLASGYIPAPVIDATNLAGGYDFSLSFSRANKLNAPSSAPSPAGSSVSGSEASDPGSGGLPPISLFDALEKQLGLKLEKRDKVDMPTLVIDHVEDHPTDN